MARLSLEEIALVVEDHQYAETMGAAEHVLEVLRRRGSPLVMSTSDGVLVCKYGTWVHGKTLAEALDALEVAIEKKGGG
jgi:hypothetical protein